MTKSAAAARDAAGNAADTVLAFVNTRLDPTNGRVERFGNAEDFSTWARERELLDDQTVTESEAAAARELRSALLLVMSAHANPESVTVQASGAAERHLAHAGELYPVKVTISTSGSTIAGHGRGAAGVLGHVLGSAYELVQQQNWSRMKACTCEPCDNGFVDRTKSGNQRYCSPSCASRSAMRAMRERRRLEG